MPRQQSDVEEFPLPSLPVGAFPPDVQPAIEAFNKDMVTWYDKINGHISLGSPEVMDTKGRAWSGHLNGEFIDVTVPKQSSDFPILHSLNRIPMGFFQMDLGTSPTTSGVLRRRYETPAHTRTQLWVWCDEPVGSTFRIWVF